MGFKTHLYLELPTTYKDYCSQRTYFWSPRWQLWSKETWEPFRAHTQADQLEVSEELSAQKMIMWTGTYTSQSPMVVGFDLDDICCFTLLLIWVPGDGSTPETSMSRGPAGEVPLTPVTVVTPASQTTSKTSSTCNGFRLLSKQSSSETGFPDPTAWPISCGGSQWYSKLDAWQTFKMHPPPQILPIREMSSPILTINLLSELNMSFPTGNFPMF